MVVESEEKEIMPLPMVCSTKAMQKTVRVLIREGYPAKQAVAIAYDRLKKSCHIKTDKRLTPKEIVAMKKKRNPYPLIIAGLANPDPAKKPSRADIDYAGRVWRGMFGVKAEMKTTVMDIPGVEDGSVGIVRGKPVAIEYEFSKVKGSIKPDNPHRHEEGDTGSEKVKPADGVIVDIVKNGKIQTTGIVRNKNVVDAAGYYIS